jgi:hypothetical protein
MKAVLRVDARVMRFPSFFERNSLYIWSDWSDQ